MILLKSIFQYYSKFPTWYRLGLGLAVLLLFNMTAWPNMKYGLENSVEASYFWVDEGRHIETLEQMQDNHSLQLIHKAYTAFYFNLSYLTAWIFNGFQTPISSTSFALGLKWVSLISINLHLLVVFLLIYHAVLSVEWAIFGMALLAGQRFNLLFATRMHPEGLMLLCTVLTLYSGYQLVMTGKQKYLWWMAASAGLAIGTKLQVIFLIPWGGFVFLLAAWKYHNDSLLRSLSAAGLSGIVFILAFFAATPYQVIHLPDLVQGVLGEGGNITDYYSGRYSAWKWGTVISSELNLGPFFTLLFILALLIGMKRVVHQWRQYGKSILDKGPEVLWVLQILWMIVGAGYIIATYRVFTNRYLIQVHHSFILIILLGLFWWFQEKAPFYRVWIKLLVALCLYGGVQGQWRHTRRDVERRETIHDRMEKHRQFGRELPQHVPVDANIIHTIRVYISNRQYPYARVLFGDVTELLMNSEFDYLIVNNNYRPAMRSVVPMKGSLQDTQDAVNFWDSLARDGIQGTFEVVAHYAKIDVTIYQKIKQ
ncbi:MAG: hypothetical protein HQM14_13075 [SAR324 cluster bacterium]|nr:hypothetical protein [SAR324 cluster bacterium]